jgi:hypothetical protein
MHHLPMAVQFRLARFPAKADTELSLLLLYKH